MQMSRKVRERQGRQKFLTNAFLGGSACLRWPTDPSLRKPKTLGLDGLNLCAFASLREIFWAWVAAMPRCALSQLFLSPWHPVRAGKRNTGHGSSFDRQGYHVFRLEIQDMTLTACPSQGLGFHCQHP